MTIPNTYTIDEDRAGLDRASFAGWDINHPLWGDFVMAHYDESDRHWVIEPAETQYFNKHHAMEWAEGCNPEPWLRAEGMI